MPSTEDNSAIPHQGLTPGGAGVDAYPVVGEGTLLDGRYRLQDLIGRGGTAEVYRGIDTLLGRAVAVKVFDTRLSGLNTLVRQQNEMQLLARLDHPNLIAVHDARLSGPGQPTAGTSGRTYLVLELVSGQTLGDLITRGPIPSEHVTDIGIALAAVLHLVHQQHLVHRDVKPANILLAENGQVKLGDFGLARALTAEHPVTAGAEVMGTAAYFSPEQARGNEVGPAADIYSLGLVLLECLTGEKEFPGEPVAAAVARLLRDPVVPPTLPAPWPDLLPGMTHSNPALRPTAAGVRAALLAASPMSTVDAARHFPPLEQDYLADGEASTSAWSSPLTPFLSTATTNSRPQVWRRPAFRAIGAGALAVVAIWATAQASQTPAAGSPSGPGATAETPSAPTTSSLPTSVATTTPTAIRPPVGPPVRPGSTPPQTPTARARSGSGHASPQLTSSQSPPPVTTVGSTAPVVIPAVVTSRASSTSSPTSVGRAPLPVPSSSIGAVAAPSTPPASRPGKGGGHQKPKKKK